MNDTEAGSLASTTVFKHGLLLFAGYAIGWFNDSALTGLLVAALAALGWHVYNTIKLRQWLNAKEPMPIPYGSSMWPTIYARISHFRERSTVHKQRSEQLSYNQSTFVQTLPNAAFELNERFEVVLANQQAIDFIDSSLERLTGHISNHLRQPDFIRYLESGDYADGVTLRAAHSPDVTLQCVISDHGAKGWLLQLIDISTQIQALQIREDFVANASHELRTPVTVLKGYLEMLVDDDTVDEDMRSPVLAMSEQVRRMEAIISDLLTLNVIESAGPAPTDQEIEVAELLQSIHQDAMSSDRATDTLTLDLTSSARILGEESEVRSVFTNLVSNALRFTPNDGEVTISWRDHEDGVEFSVRDNGIGIHEDDLPRVTERFYRTQPGRNRHQFGTGLGLAIVKHALARHESELRIESELGEGSQFSCVFPFSRVASS